jgi:hypothetical protein
MIKFDAPAPAAPAAPAAAAAASLPLTASAITARKSLLKLKLYFGLGKAKCKEPLRKQ